MMRKRQKFRVVDGGKRNFGVAPRPEPKPADKGDVLALVTLVVFASALVAIVVGLFLSAQFRIVP